MKTYKRVPEWIIPRHEYTLWSIPYPSVVQVVNKLKGYEITLSNDDEELFLTTIKTLYKGYRGSGPVLLQNYRFIYHNIVLLKKHKFFFTDEKLQNMIDKRDKNEFNSTLNYMKSCMHNTYVYFLYNEKTYFTLASTVKIKLISY